jgi:hypothetical protein
VIVLDRLQRKPTSRRAFLVGAAVAGGAAAVAYRRKTRAGVLVEPATEKKLEPYTWERVTENAGFAPRDGAGALVFRERMWLLGGWNLNDKQNFPRLSNSEVWCSADGRSWELVTPAAPWEGRHTAGCVVHRDRMWIIGGDANQGHYQPDVWRSDDGEHWECVLDNAPWGPRVLAYTAVFADKIWVMGGQTLPQLAGGPMLHYNDVWCSEDGRRWKKVTDDAPWGPRGTICGSAVLRGEVFIIGGATYQAPGYDYRTYYSDVWASADGATWRRVDSLVPWKGRSFHSIAVFDDKLWVLGGHDGVGDLSDTWYSTDGREWTRAGEPPWRGRHAASVFSFEDALWVMGGVIDSPGSPVWRLARTVGS